MTKVIEIGERTYSIGPLNFGQYESHFFEADGSHKKRPDVAGIVEMALKNAGGEDPAIDAMSAGDVLRLFSEVLDLSGLTESPKGEAQAAAAASSAMSAA